MFDIKFYEKVTNKINNNEKISLEILEDLRDKNPVVYNIETTNACNMKCKMCPRTTRMTRSIETIDEKVFRNIVDQLKPWTETEWNNWTNFVQNTYNIFPDEMSENHFFLYIIPDVIQLHGYGDPLLDKNMDRHVSYLTEKGIKSYFSCNPANINIDHTEKMFKSGLTYIKYSIESVDDNKHKTIRGDKSNFTESYNNILKLLALKKEKGYETTIIITMLDLNGDKQKEEYDRLKKAFKGLDVYIYLKSEDQLWYRQDYHQTKSIHWSEVCKHPWMSMTIKSDGKVAMCMEDYNNEIVLGDAKVDNLENIWNGNIYKEFRKNHFNNNCDLKCHQECDMKLMKDL